MTVRANNRFPFLKQVRKATVALRVEWAHRPVSPLAKQTLVCENGTCRWRAFMTMAEPFRNIAVTAKGLPRRALGPRLLHSRH